MNEFEMLPMFPLGIVVFPGELLNLHIFEPRYKALINECDNNKEMSFGIPPYFVDRQMVLGTEVKLHKIANRYPDGRMDIVVEAIGLFRIDSFHLLLNDKPYPGAYISRIEIDQSSDIVVNIQLVKKLEKLYHLMKITNVKVESPENFKTYQLAHKVGYTLDQELELLEITEETEKALFMLNHLDHLIEHATKMENIRKKAEMNGHFQHIDSII